MLRSTPTMAEQIAEAVTAFQERLTGHAPKTVSVVLSGDTLVVTLHGALSPAERALAQDPEGAMKVQEYHKQLFLTSSDALRDEIKRITGVEVREAGPTSGAVVQVFSTGTVVQIFLLAQKVAPGAYTEGGSGDHLLKDKRHYETDNTP